MSTWLDVMTLNNRIGDVCLFTDTLKDRAERHDLPPEVPAYLNAAMHMLKGARQLVQEAARNVPETTPVVAPSAVPLAAE